MNGKECRAFVIQQNILGAVAVVHVKIENSDAFDAGGECLQCGDRDIVQITKTHDLIAGGVVTGGTHKAQGSFTESRATHRFQGRAGGCTRVVGDARIRGRVRIKILRVIEAGQMFRGMRAKNGGIFRGGGFGPDDWQFRLRPEFFDGASDARRFLGVARP